MIKTLVILALDFVTVIEQCFLVWCGRPWLILSFWPCFTSQAGIRDVFFYQRLSREQCCLNSPLYYERLCLCKFFDQNRVRKNVRTLDQLAEMPSQARCLAMPTAAAEFRTRVSSLSPFSTVRSSIKTSRWWRDSSSNPSTSTTSGKRSRPTAPVLLFLANRRFGFQLDF